MKRHLVCAALAAIFLNTACSDSGTEPAQVDSTQSTPVVTAETGISWFAGSVDEAFAEAKQTDKPIFLYWGAQWCPPCHAIAATVFKSNDFINRSRSFVAVYLDGDKLNAQAAGESFDVYGYPTMIVFDPSGNELTRIPGGIDIAAYNSILDLTLNDVSPAAEILQQVIAGEGVLKHTDCRLLAYYSWGQDSNILTDRDAIATFDALEAACPENMHAEKSILFMTKLNYRIAAATDEEQPRPLTALEKEQARERVNAILNSYDLVKSNVFAVSYDSANIVAALTDPASAERQQLQSNFLVALEQLLADDTVYMRERLYTLVGKMAFERIDDAEAPISDALQGEIRDRVAWADEITTDPYERHPIINAAANILDEAGMSDVARPLLLKEIERSKQPYYFMVSLADIEQSAGNFDTAINWLEQAYAASKGPATRFQWGYYYVSGLIEMTPDDSETIRTATVELVREAESSGGFHQRPKAQLRRLESKLRDWSDDATVLGGIRDHVLQVCVVNDSAEAVESPCRSFLAT